MSDQEGPAGFSEFDWAPFLEMTATREPLEFLDRALDFVHGPDGADRLAIDLGCGGGADTRALVARGWRVFATDASPATARLLVQHIEPSDLDRVDWVIGRFDEVDLPSADLVYAQFSLPFAGARFEAAVANAMNALSDEGVFAGHFLGHNDDWAGDDGVTPVTREWVDERFSGFSEVVVDEFDADGPYGAGAIKHWHYYFVMARR